MYVHRSSACAAMFVKFKGLSILNSKLVIDVCPGETTGILLFIPLYSCDAFEIETLAIIGYFRKVY